MVSRDYLSEFLWKIAEMMGKQINPKANSQALFKMK
jgi:hypothetical protein